MKKHPRFGIFAALLLLLALILSGCCAANTLKPLKEAKALWAKPDYAALAAMEIKCKPSCDGCNQLHLLKGDACYRLAKAGDAPEKHFGCAAAELAEGIAMTQSWQMDAFNLNRSQTFINLCDALRERRDMLTGADADAVNGQLLQHARDFLSVEPDDPCGIYFESNSQYAQLRPCLLHPQTCSNLCTRLLHMQQRVDQGLAAGDGQCAEPLKTLRQDIGSALQIGNCP